MDRRRQGRDCHWEQELFISILGKMCIPMCVERALVSTMDSSRSSMVRAPTRRMFISNSSFNTIIRHPLLEDLTLNRSFNPLLTITTHSVQEWSPNTNTLGTKTNGFNDIRSSSDTAININFQ